MSVAQLSENDLARVRYEITQMMEADLHDVVEIEDMTGLSKWGYVAYRMELFNNPMAIMRVARATEPTILQNQVIGFVASRINVDELHINNVAAHPSFRRIKIGSALMETVIKESTIYGARRCILEVRATNLSAQALYNRLGFRTIGRRKDYYSLPTEDALVMQKIY